MPDEVYSVLFVCRHNTARSQMAEALLNAEGKGRFKAFSAGTDPTAELHPLTVETIRKAGLPLHNLRPKSLAAFTGTTAMPMDFVFAVCDGVTARLAASLPGKPLIAHWPIPDPVRPDQNVVGQSAAFAEAFRMLRRRIELFAALPVAGLDRLTLQRRIDQIGAA